jgi:NhaP-type Na+/H+ or K+/H+ antiporter
MFLIAVLFSCVFARAIGVFLPSLFVGLCRYFDMRIKIKQLLLIWFSGSIRGKYIIIFKIIIGAIAFALSLQIKPSLAPNHSLLVSSTLVVVLITTLLFGGLMSIFTKVIGLKEETINPSNLDYSNLMENENTSNPI